MTFFVKGSNYQRKVVIKKRTNARSAPSSSSASSLLDRLPYVVEHSQQPDFVVEGLSNAVSSSFTGAPVTMSAQTARASVIPDLFTTLPLIRDLKSTVTTQDQDKTILECLPFLNGTEEGIQYNDYGVPHLDRKHHIAFLHKNLKPLPAGYVAADASRPWMFYWILSGLSTMGEDVSPYRERLIATVQPIQNDTGGFGGGNGQISHLAPTYAIILALVIAGGQEALDLIDRKAMWKWLGSLKQRNGGFQMAVGGEVDVRGAYCAAVIITLLDLPIELPKDSPAWSREGMTLLTGLPEYVSRCQTFEGGISSRPDAEAHGAYAFCALACLCILGEPHIMIPKYLDVPLLISWLSSRQYAPEGGFSGRTNKLVDGCYSHWVGVCWPLLEACLDGPSVLDAKTGQLKPEKPHGSLYSREGLIRYILCCCQDQTRRGGLRDKPSHKSDSYHTNYTLSGLSSAQHQWHFDASKNAAELAGNLTSPYQWTSIPLIEDAQIYDEEDRVRTMHPVFAIPEGAAEAARAHFAAKGGF